jgi:putative CocE/NonD family hydrolase
LLERTPYDKDSVGASAQGTANSSGVVNYFVSRGYIVIAQDVRGRYHSEGRWFPVRDDPNDGFDTAKWIGAQPWSDGGIGTMGSSYDGATQHALAIANAPYVKAMVPRNAMSDFGRYGVRHNGAFELRFFNWVFTLGNTAGSPRASAAATKAAVDPAAAGALVDMGTRVREWVRSLPLRPGTTPLKFAPDYEAWLVEAMRHGDYDDFWKNSGSSVVDHLEEYKDVPEYHTTPLVGTIRGVPRLRTLITSSWPSTRKARSASLLDLGFTARKTGAMLAWPNSPTMPHSIC